MNRPITVVGGGLAGLTLGLGLRQRGVPVTVCESGHYPRHRVCGEFINGRAQQVLERLGLWNLLLRAGGIPLSTVTFFLGNLQSPMRKLPIPALSLSRFVLDATLAREFIAAGGELNEGTRWPNSFPEGVVRATGRRPQPVTNGWRWFGLKVHARGVPLSADLEVHALPDGYVGVSRLPGDEVNICGLFRRRTGSPESSPGAELLHGPSGTGLHERLRSATFDHDSFCAVAGLALEPQRASARDECCVGDALTMIPPVTGNGMSMAFEAAALALEPLTAFSRAEVSWSDARRTIAAACDRTFGRRLLWAGWLHRAMLALPAHCHVARTVLRSACYWRTMFAMTR